MKEFQNGQKVKLNFFISDSRTESVICTIKWIEKDRIGIVFPENHDDIIRDLPEGKEVEAIIYTGTGIYVFDSVVINSPLEHDFIIEVPDERKKIQRREYVRASLNLKLLIGKDEDDEIEARTINIGGGGVRFFSSEKLEVNEIFKFSLFMPDGRIVKGLSKVLYTLIQGRNIISVVIFTDISESDRNRLIKLCFEEEIKTLKIKRSS
jgi:c-di-GMP-binding flagellar brake protein YcgR